MKGRWGGTWRGAYAGADTDEGGQCALEAVLAVSWDDMSSRIDEEKN